MLAYSKSAHRLSFKLSRSRRRSWSLERLEERALLTLYTPAQIIQAYQVNQISFGSVKGDGSGQTIAIVDAYDAPNIASDLATFDAAFNLQNVDGTGAAVLTKAEPQGTPTSNASWAEEISLDVEWAHAIAPGAHILLVEAATSSWTNLLSAVDYARSQAGVSVVSMSWGGSEFSSETTYDSHFTTPSGHNGVTFISSAGDTGATTEWPSVSPNVVGVGGSSLVTADTSGTYSSESAWTNSGGGVSSFEAKPAYQSAVTQSSTMRAAPDVGYLADPNTGVYAYYGGALWYFGGTSVGAPQWSALVAIADQGRALNGQSSLDGGSQTLPALYSLPTSDFHDVTSGSSSNGTTTLYATAGYDLVTGLGSPYANLVVAGLEAYTGSASSGGSSGGSTTTTTSNGGHKGKKALDVAIDDLAAAQALAIQSVAPAGASVAETAVALAFVGYPGPQGGPGQPSELPVSLSLGTPTDSEFGSGQFD